MNLLSYKCKNLDELISLSIKSKQCLQSYVKDKELINEIKKDYKYYFDHVWINNPIKIKIILNSLNEDQKNAYFGIFKNLSNDAGSISCVDAGPGTGKTFLTACILMSYVKSSSYIVYTNKLSDIMSGVYYDGVSQTCCKFLMNLLKSNYIKIKNLWNVKEKTLIEKCEEIEILAKEHKPFHSLYIMDENSVVSPFFIYFMYCLYHYHKIHLLFIGDRYQQIPINNTRYHNTTNFELLEIVSQIFKLNINIRQNEDVYFVNIINNFLNYIKTKVTMTMTFDIKYYFYDLLQDKFNTKEDFKSLYFAQYHINLKDRLLRYEQYLDYNNIHYVKSYITFKNKNFSIKNDELKKFRPYIILNIGSKYIYSPNSNIAEIVTLKEINKNYIKVYCEKMKRLIMVRKISLNTYFVSDQLIAKLTQLKLSSAYQYPLKELIYTYHAAQGLTISNLNIELNMDCRKINSFYVGITRICKLDQLIKIHTKDLLSLAYTKKQNDEYFYKINKYPENISMLKFKDCRNINNFENSKSNVKIKKIHYKINKKISNDTELMKYLKLKI